MIIAERAPRHRRQAWLQFLKWVETELPARVDIHLVLDNYAPHEHPKIKK